MYGRGRWGADRTGMHFYTGEERLMYPSRAESRCAHGAYGRTLPFQLYRLVHGIPVFPEPGRMAHALSPSSPSVAAKTSIRPPY